MPNTSASTAASSASMVITASPTTGFGSRTGDDCAVGPQRLSPCASAVVNRHTMPRPKQTLRDPRTHIAQDQSDRLSIGFTSG